MPLVSRGAVTSDSSFNGTDLSPWYHSVAFIKIQAQNMSIGGNDTRELLCSYTYSQVLVIKSDPGQFKEIKSKGKMAMTSFQSFKIIVF